jgi:thiol:disulfide interchange protein
MPSALTLFATALVLSGVAGAQEKPVSWEVGTLPASVEPGKWYTIRVDAVIDAPWHVYSITQPRPPIATKITAGPGQLLRSKPARQPAPVKKYDPNFEITSELHGGKVSFELPVGVATSAKPGEHEAFVAVLYQACTEVVCLPPARDTFAVTLSVKRVSPAAAATEDPDLAGPPPVVAPDPDVSIPPAVGSVVVPAVPVVAGQGLWAFLALAAVMGGLALLTPCVFPMIPITVSYITRRNEEAAGKRTRTESVRDALIYGIGIILAFSALGLLLALIFGATGINRFAANPWVNLLVAALFIGFALDLLGIYSFRLPWQLLTKLHGQTGRGGIAGLLIMGIVFAVTTFTCTVPFVGTLLVTAAAGDWAWPLLGMLVFSTVFALPFFLLALVPEMMKSLPRSGSWMGALKVTLGIVELGAAFKFLSNVDLVWQVGILHRPVVIAIWVGLAAATGLYLLGLFPDGKAVARRPRPGLGRLAAGAAFLTFTIFLGTGLFGGRLGEVEAFLPPRIYPGDEQDPRIAGRIDDTGELAWFANYEDGLAEASATNRPIFLDFTGYTCTNCRWMEANVFSRGDIQELFGNYVLVRLYTDGQGAHYVRNRDLQLKRFGTVAMPLYAILSPTGESVATLAGLTRNSEKFASFLREPLTQRQATVSVSPDD